MKATEQYCGIIYYAAPSSGSSSFFLILTNQKFIEIYQQQIKTEPIRKLSNFNFQWTKILYQNNLKHIAFFFTFFESYGGNLLPVITPKTISYGSRRK